MGKVWLQVLTVKSVETAGVMRHLRPGDWIEVGGHLAREWLANGTARTVTSQITQLMPGCGVVVTGPVPPPGLSIEHQVGEPNIPYPRTLVWNPVVMLRQELLPSGFHLLGAWEAACPLYDYNALADGYGTPEERKRTRAVIRDLRVMLYEPGLLFVRRCEAALELVRAWQEERANGGDTRLAFLRAFYRIKPRLCALPVTWLGKTVQ